MKPRPIPPSSSIPVPPSPEDTGSWLTRKEAAELLGVSQQTLMYYEDRKFLHPQLVKRHTRQGDRKVYVYDPQELIKLPRRNGQGNPRLAMRAPGELAARCFELLSEGRTLRDIVVELREMPDKVLELRDKWLDMGGADLVITPYAKEEIEKIVGPFKAVVELVEKLNALAAKLAMASPDTASDGTAESVAGAS